ncbi:PAS domain-containing protein [Derxia gummosa]|uniref:histidine kinase n=1 Tax=Derxia gummosa DSM 723 TaxID=1121388 RepID=A0A8B6X927_9BURK|nr:PAS domain-containing protein [Derxia gummosa]
MSKRDSRPDATGAAPSRATATGREAATPTPIDGGAGSTRLDVLREAGLLDPTPDASFDRLTRVAARMNAAPIAFINFIDDHRQFIKSAFGMDGGLPDSRELPLVGGFCERVVATGAPLLLTDARLDPHFAGSLPVRALGLVSYCGVPLRLSEDGPVLGALSVCDRVPRDWSADQLGNLLDLAGAVATEVMLRRQVELQRRTKLALRRSQHQLEHATVAGSVGLWYWDLTSEVIDWTVLCKRIFGFADDQSVTYARFLGVIHPQDRDNVDEGVQAALRGEAPYHETFRVIWPDGSIRWINSRGAPVRNEDGVAVAMSGAAFDVTLNKHTELKLRASEHGLRARNDNLQTQVEARTAELQNLSRHLLHVSENEKSRLASELHDELGAYLTVLRMDLAAIQRGLRETAPALLPRLDRALATLAETTDIKRRIVEGLRPSLIDTFGLEKALQMHVEQFAGTSGLQWRLDVEPELPVLDEHRAIALYRIVQEALNNSAKYARATQVSVNLHEVAGGVRLTVADDGTGLPPGWRGRPGSHGIAGMRQRVEFFGGRFEIGPGPGGRGTQVSATVPRAEVAAHAPSANQLDAIDPNATLDLNLLAGRNVGLINLAAGLDGHASPPGEPDAPADAADPCAAPSELIPPLDLPRRTDGTDPADA